MKTEKPLVYLIIAAMILGAAPILVRLSEVGPLATGFWRLMLALPLLSLLCLRQSTPRETPTLRDYGWLFVAGALFAVDVAAWHFSLHYTTVAISTVLMNFSPVFLTLWYWTIWHTTPSKSFLIGFALTISGIVLLVRPTLAMSKETFFGILLALLSAAFYAIYLVIITRIRQKFTAVSTMTCSTIASTVVTSIIVYLAGESFMPSTASAWWILILLAVVIHVLGQGLVSQALFGLPVTISSAILLIQPIISSIMSSYLFNESLDWIQIVGIGLALVGLYHLSQTSPAT
jgi:drug/metabolite transporter (DMT)-like permease